MSVGSSRDAVPELCSTPSHSLGGAKRGPDVAAAQYLRWIHRSGKWQHQLDLQSPPHSHAKYQRAVTESEVEMSDVSKALKDILDRHPAAPFLFVGSGFSRRYLGLGDWKGLLTQFCAPIKEFGYYSSRANGNLASAASYMAADYNEWWWSSSDTAESRKEFAGEVKQISDALKYEISKYIGTFSLEDARKSAAGSEIASLSEVTIDGIITTNWDFLLEELFPDYKVFVGQDELLFSNPQSIGEIYKIHGCASKPHSLILTEEDYAEFAKKNPYLAAKLVTIFVEHPIIFIGYSITDPHIKSIIMSIAGCLTQEKIERFESNLIFVQRVKGGASPNIEKTTVQSSEFSITMTVVNVEDFSDIYSVLSASKRKIPARVLRFFKEQLYELIHTPTGDEKKLAVVDYDEIESADEVEFVVGVGVARKQNEIGEKLTQHVQSALAKKGYEGVSADEVFADCLLEQSKFEAADLLHSAFPGYGRSNRTFIPVYRYLKAAGVTCTEELAASNYEGAKKVVEKLRGADYTLPSYAARFKKEFANLGTAEIIGKAASKTEALLMLGFQANSDVDPDVLHDFLQDNHAAFDSEPYKTAYRKLICKYDRIVYGF